MAAVTGPHDRDAERVAALLSSAVTAGLVPGGVAMWSVGGRADGRTVARGWRRLRPQPAAAAPGTWYDLASLTKPLVVATLCLVAVRRKELALSTPVGHLLDEAHGRPLGGVTVEQLLGHRSGLPAWRPLYALAGAPAQAIRTVLALELERPPATTALYSCLDFILLGEILARVSGSRLDRLFADRVLEPLGLGGELGFDPPPAVTAAGAGTPAAEIELCRALGLDAASIPSVGPCDPDDGNARFLGGVAGNAGLFGTAAGVARLAAEYLEGGSLLAGDGAAIAGSAVETGRPWRLGWQSAAVANSAAGPGLSARAFGHTGFTGTSVWLDPASRSVFVLLTNRHHPGHRGTDLHPLRRRFHALAAGGGHAA